MYTKNNRTLSLEDAQANASAVGMELNDWASTFGWSSEGKQNDLTETDPPVNQNTETSVGESNSGDISLGSPEYNLSSDLNKLAEQGIFSQVEEDGQKSLEAYFKPVKGLSFEQTGFGTDYIVATYTDPLTGKKKESKRISFDDKREDKIAGNIKELNSFISKNVPAEELKNIQTSVDALVKSRENEISSFVTEQDVKAIKEKYNDDGLFNSYVESKNVGGGVAMIGAPASAFEKTVYPYQEQLENTAKDLISYAEKNKISFTEEEIKEKAQRIVRDTLIKNDIVDLKIARAKESTKKAQGGAKDGTTTVTPMAGAMYFPGVSEAVQGDQFISDAFINDSRANAFNAVTEKWSVVETEKKLATEAAELLGRMYSGESLNDADSKLLFSDLSEMGIAVDVSDQEIVQFNNGVQMPRSLYQAGLELSDTYNAINALSADLDNQREQAADSIEDSEIAIDASRRNYNIASKSVNTIGTGFATIGLSFATLANEGNATGIPAIKMINRLKIDQAGRFIDSQREQYQRDVQFKDAFATGENFGEFMLQEVSTQIPILATMIASGGAASVVAGASSAGEKMMSMNSDEIAGRAYYSDTEKLLKSVGYGLAEGVFAELTTTRIIKNTKKKWVRAGKSDVVNNSSYEYAKNNLLEIGLEPFAEAAGEVLTTGTQNLIDGRPITENMDHSGFSGYSMGLIMQAVPFVRGVYVSRHSDYKLKEKIRQKQAEAKGIQERLAKEADSAKAAKLRSQLTDINNEINVEIERVENLVNKHLTAKHAAAVQEATRKQTDLQIEAAEISKDDNYTRKEKNEAIQKLRVKFNELQSKKEYSLSKDGIMKRRSEFTLLSTTDNARYLSLTDQARENIIANDSKVTEPTEKQIEAEAYDLYLREEIINNSNKAGNVEGAKLTRFETTAEFLNALRAGVIVPLDKVLTKVNKKTKKVEPVLDENGNPVYEVDVAIQEVENGADGFNLNDEIYVSTENQVSNQRKHIATHEVGHYVFDKIFKNNPKTFNKVAGSLLKHAQKSLSRAEYKEFLNSIERDGKDLIAEEVISRFLELVADGKVGLRDVNKKRSLAGFFGATLEFVSKDTYDFDFQGESDIVNFVVGLGNKIADGSLSLKDMESASSNTIAKPVNDKKASAKAFKVAKDYLRFSKGDNISNQASKAKEVLEKVSANMDYFDPNSTIIARVVGGMVDAQLAKLNAKGLQFDKEEARSDILYRLYTNQDIDKFDGRGTLYGYINGRISFRIKDMLKASGEGRNDIVEDFNRSDIEDLKGASADVTTTEQIEERTEAERPEYRPLLNSRIATPELIESILAKIPRIVGTLKNRIDAPVSKNTTVTPLVNELRLALGKQIDIDLKKAMGGKKDGVLRRFLVDNKKAILENMTTTYLMTAFPAAVQKQVNGVFTSDWKGKKIDRETTNTDKAGRTSGAELVRRLPNASMKIDDKTFLSFILDEKGNPLRGKKESLAKAIAEELAIEIVNQEMQDPDSQIRQAFDANQERLGYEIVDNHIQKLALDLERGNVKFSKGFTRPLVRLKANAIAMRITRKALVKHLGEGESFEKWQELEETFKQKTIAATKEDLSNVPWDRVFGTLKYLNDKGLLKFISSTKIKTFIKDSSLPGLGKKAAKDYRTISELEELMANGDKDAGETLAKYDHEVSKFALKVPMSEIIYFGPNSGNIFGTRTDIVLAANSGGPTTRDARLNNAQLNATENFAGKSNKLRQKLINLQRGSNTAQQVVDTKLLGDIQAANEANAALVYSIAYDLVAAVKDGEMDIINLIRLLQDINSRGNDFGFRAFAQLSYFINGISGSPYIEHMYPSQQLLNDIISLAADPDFKMESEGKLDGKTDEALKNILKRNTLLATDSPSAYFLDSSVGNTNSGGLLRLEIYSEETQKKIYATKAREDYAAWINGEAPLITLAEDLKNIEEVEVYTKNIGMHWSKASKHRSMLAPSIKFSSTNPRAIFMVGGAGSGKSSVIQGLGLTDNGYRLVNQDPYLEKYISEAGLPTDESTYDKEQRSIRAKLGWKARKAAEEDLAQNTAAKESMIIDGTAASYNATTKKIKALEAAGFEVHMVFVNTSKAIASQRNATRAARSLPDFVVKKNWDQVQESAQKYREEYAGRFYEINTDELSYGDVLPESFVGEVNAGLEASSIKFSKGLSEELNEMIERNKGVDANKRYTKVQAKQEGTKKGKYRLFVPATAEDFRGLTSYTFAGKGKQGEADQKFIEDNLVTPYIRGIAMIEAIKQQVRREYIALRTADRKVFKMLGKKVEGSDYYTYDHALRVYMWTQQGIEIPDMSKDDIRFLINTIKANPKLIELGNAMQAISRQDTWVEPDEHWISRTLVSDLNSMTERVGRKKFLQEFIENSEIIFDKENLNKIEAIYGTRHRKAIEDALYAMTNGTNRTKGSDNAQVNAWLNWVNNSTGAIMFFNVRSALLQTLSTANFINWSDNNPLKVATAFANQPQYWKDFAMIYNSDKLKQRRSGLQTDVNAAEIANQAEGATNKANAVLTYLLKIGFTPTQAADSFAIASGGAAFYRNRINTYLKQGMDQAAAETQAFEDFSKTADEAQQSSDPYLVSQEQRSVLGRLVLAFQNTPMQYTRLMKKSMQDLANGRGDAKTHISKIIYYGAVQNFIFSALQSALFAVIPGFGDEDESKMTEAELEKRQRKDDKRNLRIVNSMTDSILKGSGVRGAVLATIKNVVTEFFVQKEKGFMADRGAIILQVVSLSPPIGAKLRKINSALAGAAFNKDTLAARGFDVTANGRLNLSPAYSIIGSAVEGVTNFPMARMVDLINGYSEALDSRNTTWQRIALALGWKTWDVGAKNEEHDLIKTEAKAKRKEEGKAKAKKTRAKNKQNKIDRKKEDWEQFSKGMSSMEKGKRYRSWSIAWDSQNKNK
jgi:chloramphenicol 3-O-phosphotransferase